MKKKKRNRKHCYWPTSWKQFCTLYCHPVDASADGMRRKFAAKLRMNISFVSGVIFFFSCEWYFWSRIIYVQWMINHGNTGICAIHSYPMILRSLKDISVDMTHFRIRWQLCHICSEGIDTQITAPPFNRFQTLETKSAILNCLSICKSMWDQDTATTDSRSDFSLARCICLYCCLPISAMTNIWNLLHFYWNFRIFQYEKWEQ